MPDGPRAADASPSESHRTGSHRLRGHRLVEKSDFNRLLRQPALQRRAGPCRLRAARNAREAPRLGLIIPKRHVARAVRRNRLKRIIRESFRLALPRLPAVDVIVQLTGDPTDAELRAILERFWSQLTSEPDTLRGNAE